MIATVNVFLPPIKSMVSDIFFLFLPSIIVSSSSFHLYAIFVIALMCFTFISTVLSSSFLLISTCGFRLAATTSFILSFAYTLPLIMQIPTIIILIAKKDVIKPTGNTFFSFFTFFDFVFSSPVINIWFTKSPHIYSFSIIS